MRLSIENGNNFDRLNRVNGIFAVESRWGLGLRTSWNYLYESLGNGASDDLVLGNVNATFRIAQSEKIMVRWGIGGWIFADDGGSDGGLNLLLSADYFPMRPFVFSGLLEGGSVGNASIFHTRITGGVLYKGLEFFGGYDFMQISDTNLHTPMLGLRVWF